MVDVFFAVFKALIVLNQIFMVINFKDYALVAHFALRWLRFRIQFIFILKGRIFPSNLTHKFVLTFLAFKWPLILKGQKYRRLNYYSWRAKCNKNGRWVYTYWVTQKLPQIYTANYATFSIQIRKITVQICGNFWVIQ